MGAKPSRAGLTSRTANPLSPSAAHPNLRRLTVVAALLAALAIIVTVTFWPVLSTRAFFLDDHDYTVKNRLVQHPGWDSARQFFTEVLNPSTIRGYYQPLTMISLMADVALGATPKDPHMFHVTSLALHVLNTLLVAILLNLLFGQLGPALLVALLFGVHPLTVEPICWIAERKTLLATCFALASLIFYALYARRGGWGLYCASLALLPLALLSKPTITPLPLLMLLLDYWPLRRLTRRAVIEKIPFLILAGISAYITFESQRRTGVAALPDEQSAWRVPLILCHNIVFYLVKFFWPTHLSPNYATPIVLTLNQPMVLAGVIGTALLLPALLISWRWTRTLLVGWLFFFVAIFPTLGVIGFTNVIAADKYAYFPILGLWLVLAHFLSELWTRAWLRRADSRARRGILVLASLLVAGLSIGATRQQITHWRDTETLCLYALQFAPESFPLHHHLGSEYYEQRRYDDAIEQYRQALTVKPTYYEVRTALAAALAQTKRFPEAIEQLQEAIRLNPARDDAYNNLGTTFAQQGNLDGAIAAYRRCLTLNPNSVDACNNLGTVLAERREYAEAAEYLNRAVQILPNKPVTHETLGKVLLKLNRVDEAIVHFRAALRLWPTLIPAHCGLGKALLTQGKVDEAIREFESALRLNPKDPEAQAGLKAAKERAVSGRTP